MTKYPGIFVLTILLLSGCASGNGDLTNNSECPVSPGSFIGQASVNVRFIAEVDLSCSANLLPSNELERVEGIRPLFTDTEDALLKRWFSLKIESGIDLVILLESLGGHEFIEVAEIAPLPAPF